ncbi:hypothetical protein K1T71_005801 [Dendrolimus kikuchii]|uniref:Uncharacterized protein n=1 Tax=Dendrolimus kikuchii TaxID=765133 RepID=A0ACC1D4Y8_9NEOP|nr:hypothetical protein K1T71_005801 [Dendrolimus kikuchii]
MILQYLIYISGVNSQVCSRQRMVAKTIKVVKTFTYQETYKDPKCWIFCRTFVRRRTKTTTITERVSVPEKELFCCPNYQQVGGRVSGRPNCKPICEISGTCIGPNICINNVTDTTSTLTSTDILTTELNYDLTEDVYTTETSIENTTENIYLTTISNIKDMDTSLLVSNWFENNWIYVAAAIVVSVVLIMIIFIWIFLTRRFSKNNFNYSDGSTQDGQTYEISLRSLSWKLS